MTIIESGILNGSFKGFGDIDTVFEFFSGSKWQQDEYLYSYCYAHMPNAKVIDENGQCYLIVDGMYNRVQVRQIF